MYPPSTLSYETGATVQKLKEGLLDVGDVGSTPVVSCVRQSGVRSPVSVSLGGREGFGSGIARHVAAELFARLSWGRRTAGQSGDDRPTNFFWALVSSGQHAPLRGPRSAADPNRVDLIPDV